MTTDSTNVVMPAVLNSIREDDFVGAGDQIIGVPFLGLGLIITGVILTISWTIALAWAIYSSATIF